MAMIEQICGSNWRPGMPKEGWLVRYGISDYGWKYMKCFSDHNEAIHFYNEKNKDN